jgi:hypothetical protein
MVHLFAILENNSNLSIAIMLKAYLDSVNSFKFDFNSKINFLLLMDYY